MEGRGKCTNLQHYGMNYGLSSFIMLIILKSKYVLFENIEKCDRKHYMKAS